MKKIPEKYDVVVIGAGPAGMISAGRAAQLGARVLLIEKNKDLGKKLLMTGKGRCNITQAKYNDREFIEKIGKNGKFLFSSLNLFSINDVIDFFEEKGLPTKTERGGRVFPQSDKANDVLRVLREYLRDGNVEILQERKVTGFIKKDSLLSGVKLKKETILADNFILCTGGKSYPTTGSTGDGFSFVKKLGHKIEKPLPALTPIIVKEKWAKRLQGLSLKNVSLDIFQNGKKVDSKFGEMLFTHFGLSGPIILDSSKQIGQILSKGNVYLKIDLKPALDFAKLDQRLQRDFEEDKNKDFKNYLPSLLPKKLIDTFIFLTKIPPEKKLHSIDKEERKKIVHLLKEMTLEASSLMGFNQAIITTGGVNIKEVDSKTMCSRKIDNLFFAGEVLDLDGPTGGFNLQICWSTGYAAGTYAAQNKDETIEE